MCYVFQKIPDRLYIYIYSPLPEVKKDIWFGEYNLICMKIGGVIYVQNTWF